MATLLAASILPPAQLPPPRKSNEICLLPPDQARWPMRWSFLYHCPNGPPPNAHGMHSTLRSGNLHAHTYTHTHPHTLSHTHIHTRSNMHTHLHTYMHAHTNMQTHIRTCTHIQHMSKTCHRESRERDSLTGNPGLSWVEKGSWVSIKHLLTCARDKSNKVCDHAAKFSGFNVNRPFLPQDSSS